MADMEVAAEFWRPGENAAVSPVGAKMMLALGGCVIAQTAWYLERFLPSRHYWRHNIVCDMSAPVDVTGFAVDHPDALRVMDKYGNKFHRRKIEQGQYDYLLMECASDHVFGYLEIDDAVVPDVRNELFMPGWGDISFEQSPELSRARMISAFHHSYWERWMASFAALYEQTLSGHIRAGKKIFFLKRFLCTEFLGPDGSQSFNKWDVRTQNMMLRRVYAFVEQLPGIIIIEPPEQLLHASVYAPWGGPWEVHPEREFYYYAAEEILRHVAGPQLAEAFRVEVLSATTEDRVRLAFRADAADQRANEAHIAQREAKASCDLMSQEVARLKVQIDQNVQAMAALRADRDRLADRIAAMRKRYAPVRAIYKALTLSWLRRLLKKRRESTGMILAIAGATSLLGMLTAQIMSAIDVAVDLTATAASF